MWSMNTCGGDTAPALPLAPVRVLAFNEVHGCLFASDNNSMSIVPVSGVAAGAKVNTGGLAYIATLISTLKAANANNTVVVVGANIGASPYTANIAHDEPTVDVLDQCSHKLEPYHQAWSYSLNLTWRNAVLHRRCSKAANAVAIGWMAMGTLNTQAAVALDTSARASRSARDSCQVLMHEDADAFVQCANTLLRDSPTRALEQRYARLGVAHWAWLSSASAAKNGLPGAAAAAEHFVLIFRPLQRQLEVDDDALCKTIEGDCVARNATQPLRPEWATAPAFTQRQLTRTVHAALYVFLLSMPLPGWLTLSAEGHHIPISTITLPGLMATDEAWAHTLKFLHETIGIAGCYLIGLQAVVALFHHFTLCDGTLTRMLPFLSAKTKRPQVIDSLK